MGQIFSIKLKDPNESYRANKIIKKYGITCSEFLTFGGLKRWVDEINKDKGHPLRHLKPKGRDMLVVDIQEALPAWTELGKFDTDVAFDRTSPEQVEKICQFIHDNKNMIEYVESADFVIDRFGIKGPQAITLARLDNNKVTTPKNLIEQYNLMVNLENKRSV